MTNIYLLGKWRRKTGSVFCGWVIVVWGKISKVSITCGFRKYCILNLLGEVTMTWEAKLEGLLPLQPLKRGCLLPSSYSGPGEGQDRICSALLLPNHLPPSLLKHQSAGLLSLGISSNYPWMPSLLHLLTLGHFLLFLLRTLVHAHALQHCFISSFISR